MRILTYTSLFPNSVDLSHGIFVYQRSAALARGSNDVVVVSPVPYFPRWLKARRWKMMSNVGVQDRVGNLQVYYPRYFMLPKIWMPFHAVSMLLGCLPRVWRLRKRGGIDVIDAHFVYPDGLAALLLGIILGVPTIVSARGTDINVYPSFRVIRPLIRWTIQRAAAVISVSQALKDSMVALGIPPEKVRVIPNGVDAERFQPLDLLEARQRLNMPEQGEVAVSVGSLLRAKGHHLLIHAVSQLAVQHPNLRLYILGEGEDRPQLEALVAELGLRDRVYLPGKRPNEELRSWFSAATVSCLVSAREGWPNVITESLACGTPVVATAVGGIPEIISNPERGILVGQSVESVAAGLKQALKQHWNRDAISREARSRTWDTVSKEIESLFQEVLSSVRGRDPRV